MSPLVISILMIIATLGVIGFDIYLDRDGRVGNTYSERIRALGRLWIPTRILLAIGIGLLLGHWFWTPQDVYDAGGVKLCPCDVTPVAPDTP
jgi:hypothetical protein